MIFWCNEQYFLHNWDQFNFGRLMGPKSENGGSLYGDENGLSAIIVTGIPFIFFIGSDLKQKWLKYLLLSFIPFGMHAIFLTGSRGGLLGLLVTVVYILLKSKSKLLFILILPAVIGFYVWQGGDVMKERGESISEYKSESSAQNRLTAWEGGLKMIEAYPFTGVGLGSFVSVLPKFIDSPPLVAHNTLVQFTAESGIGAGVCYIAIIILFYANFRSIQNWCEKHADTLKNNLIKSLNNATACSFSGFITCSIFLSLNQFEVFYYLILINNSLLSLCTISNNNNGEIHE
jgi:O-antigen ligase